MTRFQKIPVALAEQLEDSIGKLASKLQQVKMMKPADLNIATGLNLLTDLTNNIRHMMGTPEKISTSSQRGMFAQSSKTEPRVDSDDLTAVRRMP
jgi:hypothetical protein